MMFWAAEREGFRSSRMTKAWAWGHKEDLRSIARTFMFIEFCQTLLHLSNSFPKHIYIHLHFNAFLVLFLRFQLTPSSVSLSASAFASSGQQLMGRIFRPAQTPKYHVYPIRIAPCPHSRIAAAFRLALRVEKTAAVRLCGALQPNLKQTGLCVLLSQDYLLHPIRRDFQEMHTGPTLILGWEVWLDLDILSKT